MENLETGKEKIKQICEILKNETLEPAKEEARTIIANAEHQARQIIRQAEEKGDQLLKQTKQDIEKQKMVFESSLRQSCLQGIETLRQEIETSLFNQEVVEWIDQQTVDPKLGAKLITALIEAIEKEGTSTDFSALIGEKMSKEEINALLAKRILHKIREKTVTIGGFIGGVQLKLHDRKLTLDLSDEAIKELIAKYIRKDFRNLLFQTKR